MRRRSTKNGSLGAKLVEMQSILESFAAFREWAHGQHRALALPGSALTRPERAGWLGRCRTASFQTAGPWEAPCTGPGATPQFCRAKGALHCVRACGVWGEVPAVRLVTRSIPGAKSTEKPARQAQASREMKPAPGVSLRLHKHWLQTRSTRYAKAGPQARRLEKQTAVCAQALLKVV